MVRTIEDVQPPVLTGKVQLLVTHDEPNCRFKFELTSAKRVCYFYVRDTVLAGRDPRDWSGDKLPLWLHDKLEWLRQEVLE
jgi:hypothetical protein